MEKWTQLDYYQFANLFARVVGEGRRPRICDQERHGARLLDDGRRHSAPAARRRRCRRAARRRADGGATRVEDRRAYFAKWLTTPVEHAVRADDRQSRVGATFFGRGLVHPVDDLRATNPASNEELFAALTDDFVEHGFDVKRLIRTIMTSADVSALGGRPTPRT